MGSRAAITFESLPLFIRNDSQLAEAVVGPDAELKQTWLAGLPDLEAHGFPKKIGYGRYRPAVKEFFDRFHCIAAPALPGTPSQEDPDSWNTPRRRRSRG